MGIKLTEPSQERRNYYILYGLEKKHSFKTQRACGSMCFSKSVLYDPA